MMIKDENNKEFLENKIKCIMRLCILKFLFIYIDVFNFKKKEKEFVLVVCVKFLDSIFVYVF